MLLTIQKTFTFNGHDAPVYGLEVFDDDHFFSGGGDRIVSCIKTSDATSSFGIVKTGSTIYSLKFIPGKNILLTGVSNGGLHVIDLIKKKEIHFLVNHQNGIFNINYSNKYNLILTAGGDGKISFWSGDNFLFIKSLSLCNEKIRSVIFSSDENLAYAGCGDGSIRIIKIPELREIHHFQAHQSSVNALSLHPFKNIIISGGKDAHLNFWDINDYQNLLSIPAHNYAIYSIKFSPSSDLFATSSRDKTIKIWDSDTFDIISRIDKEKYSGHIHSVNNILWMKNTLVSAGDDKKIMGWKIEIS